MQAGVQLADGDVESAVKIPGTGFGPHDRSTRHARDLYPLATVRLARVALVRQLDVDPDDLVVVPFNFLKFVGNVHSVMRGHLNISALDDNVHA